MPSFDLDTCTLWNTNFGGGDLRRVDNVQSLQSCQRECQKEMECLVYTYLPSKKWCYLKTKIESVDRHITDHISGWQSCACGQPGAFMTTGPTTRLPSGGNTEICYKVLP